ncbi:MAG: DUF6982 domain-containing protein [Vicinamibacteria bacterium]
MESLKELLAGRPAVIARTRHGGLVPGYLDKGKLLTRGVLKMSDASGGPIPIDIHKLKAVFFVRDFVGNRDYLEEKTLVHDPERLGLRARLRFEDNETLEGVTENTLELLVNPGFFFWPYDDQSNNRLIYVLKSALIGFSILAVKHK